MKLDSKLPSQNNGLGVLLNDLIEKPDDVRVAIVYFSVSELTTDIEENEIEPKIRIRRIEPVSGELRNQVEELYGEAFAKRTGIEVLPLDLEREAKNGKVVNLGGAVLHSVSFSHSDVAKLNAVAEVLEEEVQ